MKFFSIAATLLTLALPAFAQDLSGLPTCAQTPTIAGISNSGCGLTDIKCICSATSFIQGLATQIAKVCGPDDVAKANAFAAQLCASVGVTLPGGSAPVSGASTPAASAPASSASAASTSAPAPASTTEAATSTTSEVSASAIESQPSAFTGAASHMKAGSLVGVVAVGAMMVGL